MHSDVEFQFFGVIESCTALIAVHYGLGDPQDTIGPQEAQTLYLIIWIAGQLYALSVGFSVLSITCFIARLTKNKLHQWTLVGLMLSIGVWMTISECVIALQCPLPRPWDISESSLCLNKVSAYSIWQYRS